mgnify:CR=1 FL=1
MDATTLMALLSSVSAVGQIFNVRNKNKQINKAINELKNAKITDTKLQSLLSSVNQNANIGISNLLKQASSTGALQGMKNTEPLISNAVAEIEQQRKAQQTQLVSDAHRTNMQISSQIAQLNAQKEDIFSSLIGGALSGAQAGMTISSTLENNEFYKKMLEELLNKKKGTNKVETDKEVTMTTQQQNQKTTIPNNSLSKTTNTFAPIPNYLTNGFRDYLFNLNEYYIKPSHIKKAEDYMLNYMLYLSNLNK